MKKRNSKAMVMMKQWMKSTCIAVLCTLSVMLSTGCSKQATSEPEPIGQAVDSLGTTSEPLSLSLTAGMEEDDLRAMTYEYTTSKGLLRLTEGAKLPSTAILRNKVQGKVYYIAIEWTVTAEGRLEVANFEVTRDLLGQSLNLLADGGTWELMAFLGGQFDAGTKRISYTPNPNRLALLEAGEQSPIDIPFYSGWITLKVNKAHHLAYQYTQAERDDTSLAKTYLRFRPAGMLMRLELENKNPYPITLHSVTFESNVLTTEGIAFSLTSSDLPNVSATSSQDFQLATTPSGSKTYSFTSSPDITAGHKYSKGALIWAMPLETPHGESPLTHILGNVTPYISNIPSGETTPSMQTLYIYGSTNAMAGAERKRKHIGATIIRPRLALENFATRYHESSYYKYLNEERTDYLPKYLHKYEDIESLSLGTGWSVPSMDEAKGLFVTPSNIGFNSPIGAREVTVYRESSINGVRGDYKAEYYVRTTNDVYALSLIDREGRKLQYVAVHYQDLDDETTITQVYLGPNYKGDISAIQQSSFWIKHNADKIVRSYPKYYIYSWDHEWKKEPYNCRYYGGYYSCSYRMVKDKVIGYKSRGARTWIISSTDHALWDFHGDKDQMAPTLHTYTVYDDIPEGADSEGYALRSRPLDMAATIIPIRTGNHDFR